MLLSTFIEELQKQLETVGDVEVTSSIKDHCGEEEEFSADITFLEEDEDHYPRIFISADERKYFDTYKNLEEKKRLDSSEED